MTYTKLVNGEIVQMSEAEIAGRQAEEAAYAAGKLAKVLPAYRDQKINGGITVSGVFIATAESDRTLINGAVTRALLDANDTKTYPYYPTGGGTVTLTNAQYKAIGAAIAAHVQKCLDVSESLDVSNYTTEQQIKDAFDAAYNA